MSKPKRAICLALDALAYPVLETWMADGTLPHLAKLRSQGAYGRLSNPDNILYENSWLSLLHGHSPEISGQWGHQHFDSRDYSLNETPGFNLDAIPAFYCRPPFPRTAIFDLPLTPLSAQVNGIQILGWGTEENQCLRESYPHGLLKEMIERYGEFPIFEGIPTRKIQNDGSVLSFRNPSIYDQNALINLKELLLESIRRRTNILIDLLKRDEWDLFLGAFSEGHIAGHLLWHGDLPHPLKHESNGLSGALREIYIALDAAIARLLPFIPEDAIAVFFAVHGMKPNNTDLTSLLFLPETLYRWQFGKAALAEGDVNVPPDDLPRQFSEHWKDEVWKLTTQEGRLNLDSPTALEQKSDPHDWSPLRWYTPMFSKMAAFPIHSFSHGMIRLNVIGREATGLVPASAYEAKCAEITTLIQNLRCARTGQALASRVWRTRQHAFEEGAHIPPADLMVEWSEIPTDIVESAVIGRIGPVPYFRTGGHGKTGFCLMDGPGIAENSNLPTNMSVTDLTRHLMSWLNIPGA